jgi:Xaa-Pro aminopeptidase
MMKLASFVFALMFLTSQLTNSSSPTDLSLSRAEVIKRREAIAKTIGENSMLIVFSAPVRSKNGDVDYEYRQQNNLVYLTGIKQPDTTLVIMPGNQERKEFLFVSDRDPARETWTGKILSKEEVTQISGIKNVFSAVRFNEFIDNVLNGSPFDAYRYAPSHEYDNFFKLLESNQALVYLILENKPGLTGELSKEFQFANQLKERFVGISIRDAWPALTRMRQVKSDYELKMLREAIDITGEALLDAMKVAKPGVWEYEVEAVIEQAYKRRNAEVGYPSIVASGANATTLHYDVNQKEISNGDLLLMDVGAEYDYYTADVTRTIPASGKFSPEQAQIYQIVFDAADASMKAIKPGAKLPDVHLAGTKVVKDGLKKLGLITDASGDQYKIWFMHGVSHWLGMDVHDTGERWRSLEPGMVFTVEPGIYIRGDALEHLPATPENEAFKKAVGPAFEKYKNIGVRIEDDVLVTSSGFEILSNKAPRTIQDIENLMK